MMSQNDYWDDSFTNLSKGRKSFLRQCAVNSTFKASSNPEVQTVGEANSASWDVDENEDKLKSWVDKYDNDT